MNVKHKRKVDWFCWFFDWFDWIIDEIIEWLVGLNYDFPRAAISLKNSKIILKFYNFFCDGDGLKIWFLATFVSFFILFLQNEL